MRKLKKREKMREVGTKEEEEQTAAITKVKCSTAHTPACVTTVTCRLTHLQSVREQQRSVPGSVPSVRT